MTRLSLPATDTQGLRHHATADTLLTDRVTVLCGRTVALGALATPSAGQCAGCVAALVTRRPDNPPGPRRRWLETLRCVLALGGRRD